MVPDSELRRHGLDAAGEEAVSHGRIKQSGNGTAVDLPTITFMVVRRGQVGPDPAVWQGVEDQP